MSRFYKLKFLHLLRVHFVTLTSTPLRHLAPPSETKVIALNFTTSGFRAVSVVELYPWLRFHVNALRRR
jgi:hypothetical protein